MSVEGITSESIGALSVNGSLRSTPPQVPSSDKHEPVQKPIVYRVEYVEILSGNVIHRRETKGINFDDDEPGSSGEQTVFEIVTTIRTGQKTVGDGGVLRVPPAVSAASVSMHILSGALVQALRNVVQYYPDQDLSSDIVKIDAPYAILVHHYKELMAYREKTNPEVAKELCSREKNVYEHIGILKEFLDEHVMSAVEEEHARNKRGAYTFDMFWVALKPGTMFHSTWAKNGRSYSGIVHSIQGGTFHTPATDWIVQFWYLTYNGTFVDRTLKTTSLAKFDGEFDVSMVPVDIDNLPDQETVNDLVKYGKLYWSHLKKQCSYYKGKTESFPYNDVDGLVMVDMDAYYEAFPDARPDLLSSESDSRTWVSDCTCPVCNRRRDSSKQNKHALFADYELLSPKVTDELEDSQYFLLPSHIYAYVFRTRTWELLHVKGLSEPNYEETMIDQLVMDEKRKTTLKALAKSFIRVNQFGEKSSREPWSADFVKGKGNGLIFLLHGSPGTGKTCTAECIAAFTHRPLMVLTSSDIGTYPAEVERNLTESFKRARSWGAVLLVDEADVFMERRSTADLTRNSLVAGFLRALEFYDGLLFLTTNRIGSFDDAFISRIHFQLGYPDFTDENRRKVWQTFIDKLERERGDYIRLKIDAKEYLDGKEMKAVKWNGREIRNAFQTAVALAEYEATKDAEGKIILTDAHLRSVVEMSRDFKEYLKDLHRGDEGKRAERRSERLNQ